MQGDKFKRMKDSESGCSWRMRGRRSVSVSASGRLAIGGSEWQAPPRSARLIGTGSGLAAAPRGSIWRQKRSGPESRVEKLQRPGRGAQATQRRRWQRSEAARAAPAGEEGAAPRLRSPRRRGLSHRPEPSERQPGADAHMHVRGEAGGQYGSCRRQCRGHPSRWDGRAQADGSAAAEPMRTTPESSSWRERVRSGRRLSDVAPRRSR